jgi:predicted nucleic acid-binding protein
VFVDTNVVVRFLTGEPPEQAERARALFDAAAAGAFELFLPPVILVEAGFVLHRVLRLERSKVATLLGSLGNTHGLVMEQPQVVQRMLELFETSAIPLADAYLAAFALVRGGPPAGDLGLPVVVSFDRHFDAVAGLRRIAGPSEAP